MYFEDTDYFSLVHLSHLELYVLLYGPLKFGKNGGVGEDAGRSETTGGAANEVASRRFGRGGVVGRGVRDF